MGSYTLRHAIGIARGTDGPPCRGAPVRASRHLKPRGSSAVCEDVKGACMWADREIGSNPYVRPPDPDQIRPRTVLPSQARRADGKHWHTV
jgi:hypothetical protein